MTEDLPFNAEKTDDADDAAIINVHEDGYYLGLWYLEGEQKNFLATVFRNPGEELLRLTYRFRYRKDNRVFDSADEKSVYRAVVPKEMSEGRVISALDKMVDGMIASGFCHTRLPWKLRDHRFKRIVRGDGHAWYQMLIGLPFVHMKVQGS
jgi:hypothetical protein